MSIDFMLLTRRKARKEGAEDSQSNRSCTAHTEPTSPGWCGGAGRATDGHLLFLKVTVLILALIVAVFPAPAQMSIGFMQDVYAISPYGDVVRMNPLWWADDAAAALTGDVLAGTPQRQDTSPQTGPALKRWHVSHVPASLVPPGGLRVTNPSVLVGLLNLPVAEMWVIRFPGGCIVNDGYLADGMRRNGGLNNAGIAAGIRLRNGECFPPPFSIQALTAPVRGPVRGVKWLLGKHKYPSLTADGKKLPRLPRK